MYLELHVVMALDLPCFYGGPRMRPVGTYVNRYCHIEGLEILSDRRTLCRADREDLGWNRQSLKGHSHSAQPVHTPCRSQPASVRQIYTFTMCQLLLYRHALQ